MITSEARGAWNDLERHLRPYLARRVSSSADIDDMLQEIFVKLHQGLADLRNGERFGGWVYRIAKNVIADRARSRARQPVVPLVAEAEDVISSSEPDDDLQSDLSACVALFVSRLPSPYREAITLTELEGLTQKDAADMLGISVSGMKSRVQRGREKIRYMFDECCRISVDCRGRVIDCQARDLTEVAEGCRDTARSWAERERH